MKKVNFITIALLLMATTISFGQNTEKLVSQKTHIKFFSSTPAEDIEANNYATVGTINKETGEVVFSVPMQSFEFDKRLMQKHFNSDKFLDTQTHPKAKLKGKIINSDEIDFSKDGSYNAMVEGKLTIKGVTNTIKETGKIIVKGKNVTAHSEFNITLADYGIEFIKGKPASNIAKTVKVTVHAEF